MTGTEILGVRLPPKMKRRINEIADELNQYELKLKEQKKLKGPEIEWTASKVARSALSEFIRNWDAEEEEESDTTVADTRPSR